MRSHHPHRTLAAVFPHPDDESFATGGLLAASALLGARVVVITATRGEGSRDALGNAHTPEELAAIRGRELDEACEALGAEAPIQLGFPDGSLASAKDLDDMLIATLRTVDPDVVVTFGPDGAYGHQDHVHLTERVHNAFDALPGVEHRRLLHTAFPTDHFRKFHVRMLTHAPDSTVEIAALGVARELVNWILPLTHVHRRKRAAIQAHASQLGRREVEDFLGAGAMRPLLEEEWYIVAGGQSFPGATASSAFEGLP